MEHKLIYADELEKKLIDMGLYPALVSSVLEKMKPVDAVEVVPCRECKRFSELSEDENQGVCNHALPSKSIRECYTIGHEILAIVRPDDFCSYGERKNYE